MKEIEYSITEVNKRRKLRQRRAAKKRITCLCLSLVFIVGGIIAYNIIFKGSVSGNNKQIEEIKQIEIPDWVDSQIITKHSTARTGRYLEDVNDIVLHYVGNPNTTAQNNRDYFNKPTTDVSSHFVVGLEGEIIQCIPLWERSAASNNRNKDTISIEVCHPDESGKFNEATYNSVIKLISWLMFKLGLDETNILRHYDITEKLCPIYYVENDDEWKGLKKDVSISLNEYKKE